MTKLKPHLNHQPKITKSTREVTWPMVWRRSIGTSSFKHADGHKDERAQVLRYLQGHGWSRGVIDKVLHNKEMEKFSIARSTQKHSMKGKRQETKSARKDGAYLAATPKTEATKKQKGVTIPSPHWGGGRKKSPPIFLCHSMWTC